MTHSTRDQMLLTARTLFAERGFYGVSLANIADELGLTKQALLHHFSTKEKLYGEVLQGISDEYAQVLNAADATDAAARLTAVLADLIACTPAERDRARLLMRELLDNKRRADAAGAWYLKPFLVALVDEVRLVPAWDGAPDEEVLACIYQLLGAISYFAVSEPTLRGIFGDDHYDRLVKAFEPQLKALVTAALGRAA